MARFIYYEDNKKEWRWRLVADNGRIIADGAEGYETKQGVQKAISRFVELAAQAEDELALNDKESKNS